MFPPPYEARPDMTSKTSQFRKHSSQAMNSKQAKQGKQGKHAKQGTNSEHGSTTTTTATSHPADASSSQPIDVEADEFALGRSAIGGPQSELRGHASMTDSEELSASSDTLHGPAAQHWTDLDWPVVIWIGVIHAAALVAPFYFTWSGLAICVALSWATGSLGVCLGYHRLLTHGSFSTTRAVKMFYAWMGGISGEGSALHWVANHRK
ncbi:MAG: hypothetical protein DWH87_06525, partial [Planctomycetota bacterium]